MKILIYVPEVILDAYQGDAIHVRELAQNLMNLGMKVNIISRLTNKNYNGPLPVRRVTAPKIRAVGVPLWGVIHNLVLAATMNKSCKYDLIYTRSMSSASAFILSHLTGLPYVTEVNGLKKDEINISSAGKWGKTFGYFTDFLAGKSYKYGLHLIAVTPQIKAALITDYDIKPDKITVIPNGANTHLFKPMDATAARNELNLSEAEHSVIFVGHLVAWQGVQYLIEGVLHVLKESPTSKFLIVGDGPMKQELLALAQRLGVSDNVVFGGKVPYEKVPVYLNASDVCVAPFTKARNERCGLSPLKIHEYMACGKPVVASRIPNLESLEESGAGILVEPENPQELGDAIIKLLKDEKLRGEMGNNGRKYVVENHSWARVARTVANTCEMALTQKKHT